MIREHYETGWTNCEVTGVKEPFLSMNTYLSSEISRLEDMTGKNNNCPIWVTYTEWRQIWVEWFPWKGIPNLALGRIRKLFHMIPDSCMRSLCSEKQREYLLQHECIVQRFFRRPRQGMVSWRHFLLNHSQIFTQSLCNCTTFLALQWNVAQSQEVTKNSAPGLLFYSPAIP